METPPVLPPRTKIDRRNAVTLKLVFIVGLVLLLQIPLLWVNSLRQDRTHYRQGAEETPPAGDVAAREVARSEPRLTATDTVFDAYRMVERAVKHGVLVLALVFTAFFLFEILAGLRLHPVHYSLVGAALCLFYLALLALGEVIAPSAAYVAAATGSSLLITLYSAAILRLWARAGIIAGLLAAVHSVLFVVLRMEGFALLAGTAALFVALAAVMFFTRNVDWYGAEASNAAAK